LTTGPVHVAHVRAGWSGFAHPDCPPALLSGDPLAVLLAEPHETIRDRPTARTLRVTLGGVDMYAKHITHGRRSRLLVRRNFDICRRMNAAGVQTPPILLAVWHGSGRSTQSLLVTGAVDAPTLHDRLRAGGDYEQMSPLMRMVGQRLAELHRRRFVHGDLLPGNMLLIDGGRDLAYLDNDRTRRFPVVPPAFVRMQNLFQLLVRVMSPVAWRSTRQLLAGYFQAMDTPERQRRLATRRLLAEVRRRRHRRGFVRVRGRPPAGR
jgi:tRNA A-37 threonylcarbamoyl transferase component Bud32